jgi:hypothetical protein
MTLTFTAREALAKAYSTRGPHRGQLLAKCPRSTTLAAAAWQGAMIVANPYKVGIATMMFFTIVQRGVFEEVKAHFEKLPHDHLILAQRDREALERLGVW